MNAIAAYSRRAQTTESPRQAEQAIFIRLTRQLEQAEGSTDLANAVDENRRLWARLMADLIEDGNQMEPQTKAMLIGLGQWVGRHSSHVLAGKADASALVDVNKSIIKGLGAHVETPMQEAGNGTPNYGTA